MGMQIDSKVLSQKQATIQAALDAKKGTPAYDISIFRDDVLTYGTQQQKEAYKKLTGWTKEAAEAEKLRRWANIGKNKGQKSGVIEADRRAAEFIQQNTKTKVTTPIVLDEAKRNYKHEIGDVLKRKPEVNAGTVDDMLAVGKTNEVLDGMGDYYRFLEERSDYKRAVGDVLKRKPEVNVGTIDDMLGIGKTNGVLDRLNDDYKFLEGRSDYKRAIEGALKNRPEVTAGTIDDMLGIGKSNDVLDGMGDYYRFLEERSDYKRAVGKVLERRPEVNAGTIDDMLGIGKTNDTLDAMGDYYRLLEEQGNKGNKFLDFFKNNKKALLIGAGILAAAGLATWAISKYNDKKAEEEVVAANAAAVPPEADVNNKVEATVPPVFPGTIPPENDIVVPYRPGMQPGAEDETTPEGEDGTVPGAVVPTTPEGKDVEKEEDTDNVPDAKKQVKPSEVATKEYVVKPGDNVWNIAKKQLSEELGRKPYNREIAVRTKEILEKNNLKYEADNYTVLIYPGGKLDIAS